ncbi:hypothetical protein Hanom_Chr16g01518971 [Helianthus anomalus]
MDCLFVYTAERETGEGSRDQESEGTVATRKQRERAARLIYLPNHLKLSFMISPQNCCLICLSFDQDMTFVSRCLLLNKFVFSNNITFAAQGCIFVLCCRLEAPTSLVKVKLETILL